MNRSFSVVLVVACCYYVALCSAHVRTTKELKEATDRFGWRYTEEDIEKRWDKNTLNKMVSVTEMTQFAMPGEYYCDFMHRPGGPIGTKCLCGTYRMHDEDDVRRHFRKVCNKNWNDDCSVAVVWYRRFKLKCIYYDAYIDNCIENYWANMRPPHFIN